MTGNKADRTCFDQDLGSGMRGFSVAMVFSKVPDKACLENAITSSQATNSRGIGVDRKIGGPRHLCEKWQGHPFPVLRREATAATVISWPMLIVSGSILSGQ